MSATSTSSPSSAPTSRVVRAFISSTFRDFGEERDLLVKRVFPELRRRARARFVEVIGVDLRWGITEEESQRGETLPICLREIERSRPYFIGLLGERYGWTPEAGQYPAELLERQPWLAEHAGGKSVTELEILHGVLNSPEMAGRACFYFRDPAWSEGKGDGFRSEGADERARLARLKERIRASPFPVAEYATPESLADRITEDLWRLIDAEYPESEVPDELERERRSHEAYAHERRRLYVGQEETVATLLARLEGASDEKGEDAARSRTTLVTGESGTGKSALIANVLEKYREAHPDHVVIEHYIGSTSDAADPTKLMRRIAGEIRKLTGSSREIEDDPEKLEEQFAEWLAEASWWAGKRGVKVVIALDALDKLSGEERLRWLPKTTAPHLRIVLSSLESESREVLEKRGIETLAAKPFTNEVARAYLVETLARRGRRLPEREVERIVAHPRATLPIYLKTLVEELSVFGSYEGLPQRITECLAAEEPDDLFEVILARVEGDLGEERVRKPLEAIWASADGMSEDELVAYTGATPLDLARLRLSLDDALYESGGLLRLAHAYMSKAAEDRYLPAEEQRRGLHRQLGLWWEGREASERMGFSVDWHLYRAEAWDDLERCLTSPRTAAAVLGAVDVYSVYRSWSKIANAHGAKSVGKCIDSAIKARWREWVEASEVDGEVVRLDVLWRLSELSWRAEAMRAVELVAQQQSKVARVHWERAQSLESRQSLATSLQCLGKALAYHNETDAARRCFGENISIARQIAEKQPTPMHLRYLGDALDDFGYFLGVESGKLEALACFEESLEVRIRLSNQDSTPRNLLRVASSLNAVGVVRLAHGDVGEALARFEASVEIAKQLFEREECAEHASAVMRACNNIGVILDRGGDKRGALQRYEESLAIARRRVEIEEMPSELRDLSTCLANVGLKLRDCGNRQGAIIRLEESLRISHRLVKQCHATLVLADEHGSTDLAAVLSRRTWIARIKLESWAARLGALLRIGASTDRH
jgi:tetratricopeptide (TPR) repeat protein